MACYNVAISACFKSVWAGKSKVQGKALYTYFSHVAKSWVTLRLRRGMGTDDLATEVLEGHGVCCLH